MILWARSISRSASSMVLAAARDDLCDDSSAASSSCGDVLVGRGFPHARGRWRCAHLLDTCLHLADHVVQRILDSAKTGGIHCNSTLYAVAARRAGGSRARLRVPAGPSTAVCHGGASCSALCCNFLCLSQYHQLGLCESQLAVWYGTCSGHGRSGPNSSTPAGANAEGSRVVMGWLAGCTDITERSSALIGLLRCPLRSESTGSERR